MPRNVLLVDPMVTGRIHLSMVLEDGHYAVAAVDAIDGIDEMDLEPDLVILSQGTESQVSDVGRLCRKLGRESAPVLVLDANPSALRRLATLRAGAREVFTRTSPDTLLLAQLRAIMRECEAERECARRRTTAASFGLAETAGPFEVRSLVCTIDPTEALPTLPDMIRAASRHRVLDLEIADALAQTSDHGPDAYVVACGDDWQILDSILPELRDRSHSRRAPVMVVCPADRPEIAIRALALGASELAADTATGEELALRIDRMLARKHMRDALRRIDEQSYLLATTDPLTGLHNRRYAEAYLADLMMRTRPEALNFAVMLVDLDHFKSVNDRHGHAAGDKVLCEIANRLRDNLRACDLIARQGGEEFLVVLPETRGNEAARTAERLRSAVSNMPVALGDDRQIKVTASIGVAEGMALAQIAAARRPEMRSLPAMADLLEAADVALYRAKECGRNRVEFSAA